MMLTGRYSPDFWDIQIDILSKIVGLNIPKMSLSPESSIQGIKPISLSIYKAHKEQGTSLCSALQQ